MFTLLEPLIYKLLGTGAKAFEIYRFLNSAEWSQIVSQTPQWIQANKAFFQIIQAQVRTKCLYL